MLWMLLTIAVAGAVVALLLGTALGPPREWDPHATQRAHQLIDMQKEQALRKLKDLEHEHEAGLLDTEEYEALRKAALTDAALVERRRQAIESRRSAPSTTPRAPGAPTDQEHEE